MYNLTKKIAQIFDNMLKMVLNLTTSLKGSNLMCQQFRVLYIVSIYEFMPE